jgi:ABC-type bacteriocin/lantibiotic exporter with double-glycine peptidase domain
MASRLIAWVLRRLRILTYVLPLLFSCAGVPDVRESTAPRIIENVPYFAQEAYQCGPASLAGVLNYWQVVVSPEDIAAEIYSESAKGTLDVDMVLYAQRKGLRVKQYEGSIEDIKCNIDLGHPVIVLVDYGFWVYQQNHYMVVVGYNEKGILANSGKERLKFISFKDFLKSWKRTEFWTMLIESKH